MIDIAIDANNDIYLTNGDITLVSGADETAQLIKSNLNTFYGEWFAAPEFGMKYRDVFLIKAPYRALIEQEMRETLLNTSGVRDILSLTFSYDNATRKLTISFKVSTDVGIIKSTEVFS